MGPDAFRKARAPNPFEWEATAAAAAEAAAADADKAEESERRRPRRRAFFEMAVDGVSAGRVEFELASDLLPVTSENFLRLCDGVAIDSKPQQQQRQKQEAGGGAEEMVEKEEEEEAEEEILSYEGSVIHRVVTGTGIMGGDVEGFGGKRSHSAFNGMRFFPDEAFLIPHTYVLCVVFRPGVHRACGLPRKQADGRMRNALS
ncbi:unnamed protein product [Scytosiphon promiscuus]